MSEHLQDARHAASPAQLLQARRDGDSPRSHELATAIQLFVCVVVAYFLTQMLAARIVEYTGDVWTSASVSEYSTNSLHQQIAETMRLIGGMLLPLLGVIALVSVFSHAVQNTSLAFFSRPILDINRLSPTHRLSQTFSWTSLVRAAVGIPKLMILIAVCMAMAWNLRLKFADLALCDANNMIVQLADCVFSVLIACTGAMLVLASFDFAIERISFLQRNRMTDQQLRDETRMQETDPQIGQRRQQFHRELS